MGDKNTPFLTPIPDFILGITPSPTLYKIDNDVHRAEEAIYRLPVEKGFGWDMNRTLVTTPNGIEGDENKITWEWDTTRKLFDGIVTHNHPRTKMFPWSFPCPSWTDLQFMHDNFLTELRVVSKDMILWHKKAHRVCHRRYNSLYTFKKEIYFQVMQDEFKVHHIPYTVDEYGVHANEFIMAALLSMDVTIQKLGRMWGFDYYAWTD